MTSHDLCLCTYHTGTLAIMTTAGTTVEQYSMCTLYSTVSIQFNPLAVNTVLYSTTVYKHKVYSTVQYTVYIMVYVPQ